MISTISLARQLQRQGLDFDQPTGLYFEQLPRGTEPGYFLGGYVGYISTRLSPEDQGYCEACRYPGWTVISITCGLVRRDTQLFFIGLAPVVTCLDEFQ